MYLLFTLFFDRRQKWGREKQKSWLVDWAKEFVISGAQPQRVGVVVAAAAAVAATWIRGGVGSSVIVKGTVHRWKRGAQFRTFLGMYRKY